MQYEFLLSMIEKRKEEIKKIVPRLQKYDWKESDLRYQKAIVGKVSENKCFKSVFSEIPLNFIKMERCDQNKPSRR